MMITARKEHEVIQVQDVIGDKTEQDGEENKT